MAVETVPATTPVVEDAAAQGAAPAGDHAATTSAEHGGGGLPQFQFEHWGGQIGYLLILFVILYVLIARVFAPRMRRVFDERASTIADALSSARAVQAQADSQAEDAKRALADARAAAQRTASEAKAKAEAEASARKAALEADLSAKQAEAEARIRTAREATMKQLSAVATDAAEAMVEKLTGAKAPKGAIAAAIKSQG